MKTKLTFTVILLITLAAGAAAQNRIKLFDPTNISFSDPIAMANALPWGSMKSAEVYLSCDGRPTSSITGPNGGGFIVDNMLMINGGNACGGGWCFTTIATPTLFVGQPVEAAYGKVGPFDQRRLITGSGLYRFDVIDYGYTYGTTEVYLETTCQIVPVNVPPGDVPPGDEPPVNEPNPPTSETGVICHRNSGSSSPVTLSVAGSAVQSHLAHGDTLGPCGQ